MKKAVLVCLLLSSTLSFAVGKEGKVEKVKVDKHPHEVKVSVNGMVCGFCAQGIEKKLKAEKAVEKVDVSLEKKVVTIDFKEGKSLTDDQISSLMKESGYNVEKIDHDAGKE